MIVVGIVIGFIIGVATSAQVHRRKNQQQLVNTSSTADVIGQRHQDQIKQLKRQHLEELSKLQSLLAQAYQQQLPDQSNTSPSQSTEPSDSATSAIITTLKSDIASVSLADLPQLTKSLVGSDSSSRQSTLMAIATVADLHGDSTQLITSIPILAQFVRDRNPDVRKAAVFALSKIKSNQVISPLKIALKDTHLKVVESANQALNKFKFYPSETETGNLKPIKNFTHQSKVADAKVS